MALVNTTSIGVRCLVGQENRMTIMLFRSLKKRFLNQNFIHCGRVMMTDSSDSGNVAHSTHRAVEGLMGRQEHEFSVSRSREISTQIADLAETDHERSSTQSNNHNQTSQNPAEDSHIEVYDSNGSVSLHSCMQSNVPHPFDSSNKAPGHMNMPQGGVMRLDKYVYHNVQKTHPNKNFSTHAAHYTSTRKSINVDGPSVQGVQVDYGIKDTMSDSSIQGPQGVQGMDCPQFNLWLENCVRMGRNDCLQEVENIKTGKKTLSQVFAEQDEMIQNVARSYRKSLDEQKRSYSTTSDTSIGEGEVKLSQRAKLKKAVKDYGATVIVFHVGISLISLGGFYLAVSSGLDVVSLLDKIGVSGSSIAAGASTFVMAYAVHKVFAPVRIATTLTATPFIVRYLRRIGFLKNPVNK